MLVREIKIISLNIQHGWNLPHPLPPVFIRKRKMLENLDRIIVFLKKHDPDVILLQEVDRISPLTRKIDQLEYIRSEIGHTYSAFGGTSEISIRKQPLYSAGCAIISRFPLVDVQQVKFESTFPIPRKGFISARVRIAKDVDITVVCVHLAQLDVTKKKSRETQIKHMMRVLHGSKSMIIGGDLNISARSKGRVHIHALMKKFNVTTRSHSEYDTTLNTYPAAMPRRRVDWILTSSDLTIKNYQTLTDRVSDHLAVGTTISV